MLAQLIPPIVRIILWIVSHPYGRTVAVEGITRVAVRASTRTIRNWPRRPIAPPLRNDRSLAYAHGKRSISHVLQDIRQKLPFRCATTGAGAQEHQALKSRIRRRVFVVATVAQLAVASQYPFESPWTYDDDYDKVSLYENSLRSCWPEPVLKCLSFSVIRSLPFDPHPNRTEKANPIERAWSELRHALQANE